MTKVSTEFGFGFSEANESTTLRARAGMCGDHKEDFVSLDACRGVDTRQLPAPHAMS
jgi:hypothetical protein